ncbi:MAG: ABC transporter ATP-binding protein [Coriobacteriales bacterium]|jgi:ABC-type sugar transport system ATPase subunit|nr:ABC transporter ATP-binding protein [Coriobacteriales bacterium]
MSLSFLELENLSKTYRGNAEPTVQGLDLRVAEGEIVVLLGASGCGKTTILKMVAGLEPHDDGHIHIDGELMDGVRAEKRPIAMVFQKALLFRNMTVAQNINFAPRLNRSMSRSELAAKTQEMLELMQLEGMGNKRATQLSGGQEQRVSLARALMTNPKLLLLDEPLSALDAELRVSMRSFLKKLNRELGTTMLFVTHDQEEAISLADKVALLFGPSLAQFGKPEDFYTRPATEQVARFFGWKNLIAAQQDKHGVRCGLGSFVLPDCAPYNGTVTLAIRPEAAIEVGSGSILGTIARAEFLGSHILYTVDCNGVQLELSLSKRHEYAPGSSLTFNLDPSLMWVV